MLIVGLGNPGKKYEETRHNLGFWVVDALVSSLNKNWAENKKLKFLKAEFKYQGNECTILKPQTFMNLSGDALVEFLKWNDSLNISEDLLVIYDDLDFDCGVVKFKKGGSAGGHNGLADIISKTGTNDFCRLRMGIGHPRSSNTNQIEVKDWVLRKPGEEDYKLLNDASAFAVEAIKIFMSNPAVKRESIVRDFISKREG